MYYLVTSLCRSTESVVAMAPEVRGCLTAAEPQYPPLHVELFAFRDYTKSSCLLECRAAAMLRLCQVRLGPHLNHALHHASLFQCLVYNYPDLPPAFVQKFHPSYSSPKDVICKPSQLQCIANHTGGPTHTTNYDLHKYIPCS